MGVERSMELQGYPAEEIARVAALRKPPDAVFPLCVSDAVALADWYARYALDRLPDEPRSLHAGVSGFLTGGVVQLRAAVLMLDPENDRVLP